MSPRLASPTADMSVRPALPEDLAMLGDIHARTLRASLTAGLGRELDETVLSIIDGKLLAQQWADAVTAPPSHQHQVLTALDGARIVGFAAFAPTEVPMEVRAGSGGETTRPGRDVAEDAREVAPSSVAEILALEVPPAEGRRGHGSRLLAACADLLRDQGCERLQTWVVEADETRGQFLAQAGFAPAGVRRLLDVAGEDVTEVCWYADL